MHKLAKPMVTWLLDSLLCKVISEVLYIKDMTGSFTLVFPVVAIGIKDTVTKQID